ncbi:MAG: hypothetical protein DSY43_05445 [Gammaproteobacteria bacterium]|nr:MAG: hypothetical protein DSY43_05445 [Gammaproteobacteria bacterium]
MTFKLSLHTNENLPSIANGIVRGIRAKNNTKMGILWQETEAFEAWMNVSNPNGAGGSVYTVISQSQANNIDGRSMGKRKDLIRGFPYKRRTNQNRKKARKKCSVRKEMKAKKKAFLSTLIHGNIPASEKICY